MRTAVGKALGFLGFTPETRAYVRLVAKQVGRDLFSASRREFLLSVLASAVVLVVLYFVTGELEVTALVTFLTLVGLLLFFAVRGFLSVAAARNREHEDQTHSHRDAIRGLTERIEMARWARAVRQEILRDLLDGLPDRRDAGDVREALLDAIERCQTRFSHLPGDVALVPERLYELADKFKSYDEEEKNALIRAVKSLQTSTMADPDI